MADMDSLIPLALRHETIPSDARVYAISDMHGHLDIFLESMTLIRKNLQEHPLKKNQRVYLLTLGDYIDKGENSCAVISALRAIRDIPVISLIGNHEKYLIDFINGPRDGDEDGWNAATLRWFLRAGGEATLRSYKLDVPRFSDKSLYRASQEMCAHARKDFFKELRDNLYEKLKECDHLEFLSTLCATVKRGHFIFCHAQLLPNKLLAGHSLEQIISGHEIVDYDGGFFNGHVVIYGHSSYNAPPRCKPYSIGIDPDVLYRKKAFVLMLDGSCAIHSLITDVPSVRPLFYPPGPANENRVAIEPAPHPHSLAEQISYAADKETLPDTALGRGLQAAAARKNPLKNRPEPQVR